MKVLVSARGPALAASVVLALVLALGPTVTAGDATVPDRPLQRAAEVAAWVAPPVDVPRLMAEDRAARDRKNVPRRVGFPMKAALTPAASGTWTDQSDGSRLWQLDVRSEGALWIVVGFSWFDLQPGAELTVTDRDRKRVLGPFTSADVRSHDQLWFPPIDGDGVRIELYWPADLADETPRLRLGTVSHGYRDWQGRTKSSGSGPSGSCNVDVACDPAWSDESRSVVRILSGGFAFCSGALINNTANDCTPYVLTANHCNVNAPSTTFQFNYECSLCEGGTVQTGHTLTGATRMANYSGSDFDLLRLDQEIPEGFNAYFAGWSRSTSPATGSTAIHHPHGDVKKITHNDDPLVNGRTSDGGWGATHWRVEQWEEGTTEPSSSGSPMFDQNHRIVGQLHGGFASCTAITWDEFGKFDVSWVGNGNSTRRLSDWLDPLGSGAMTLDGRDANACLAPAPVLEIGPLDVDDSGGNGDGVIDPGESLLIYPRLDNTGGLPATQVSGTLSESHPLVDVDVDGASWPDIPSASSAMPLTPFSITLAPDFQCGDPIDLTLDATSAEGSWTASVLLETGIKLGTEIAFEDDMESGDAAWTTQNLSGANDWFRTTGRSNSPTTSWFVNDLPSLADSTLVLETLSPLPAGARLTFRHWMSSEAGFDGGVLEYTVDGGQTWLDAKPMIDTGPYNLTIDTGFSSPLAGRSAWSGNLNGWQTVSADLQSLAGQNVGLRWRFACDSFLGSEGWYVDDVVITEGVFECNPVTALPPGEASSPLFSSEPLRIAPSPDGHLLSWSAPATGGPVADYVLYGSPLGGLKGGAKGASLACLGLLGPGTSSVIATADLPPNTAFLVVARNVAGEGSYGTTGDGSPRTPAQTICP